MGFYRMRISKIELKFSSNSYLQSVKTRPQDKPVIEAGVELVINLLQNINDIANSAL